MMVKNEEKNLPRCFESLTKLLQKPYVELIVVDTGSTDKSVEIASSYTTKVFHHPWNNDFSDMRNITISYAKGEWIFILDADEALADEQKVIELLEGNDLKKFNTVQFLMNDYTKLHDPTSFLTYNSFRLFKNTKGFGYDGAVHNQPRVQSPVYYAKVILNHFGYQFDDKDLLERKFKRTSEILLKELEESPSNIYYRYQLANSYFIHGDLKEAFEQVEHGYDSLLKMPKSSWRDCLYIFGEYGRESYANNKFNECIEVCTQGIEVSPDYVDLYFYTSLAYQALNNPDKSIEYALKYLDLYDCFESLKISNDASIIMLSMDRSSESLINSLLSAQLHNKGDFNKSLEYCLKVLEGDTKNKLIFENLFKLGQYKRANEFYIELAQKDSTEAQSYAAYIEALKERMEFSEKKHIEKAFANGYDDYAILNKIRISEGEIGHILTLEFIRGADYNKLDVYYSDVLKNFNKYQKEILTSFKKVKSFKLKQLIKYMLDHFNIEAFLLNYIENEKVRSSDYESNRIFSCIGSVLFLNEIEKAKNNKRDINEQYLNLFGNLIEKSIRKLSHIYQLDKMRLYYSTLDQEEDQFFILLHFASEAQQKSDYKAAMRYIKEAVEVFPYFALVLRGFRNELFVNVERDLEPHVL
jgi:glycosyltransferase involved in cell wall biosynthesis